MSITTNNYFLYAYFTAKNTGELNAKDTELRSRTPSQMGKFGIHENTDYYGVHRGQC